VKILADHNLEGQAILIWGTLAAEGWLDLLPLQLLTLEDIGLPADSSDRDIWRFAQNQRMILLTGNRRMRAPDSLEQTIRAENTDTCLPVITIGSVERMDERAYRERCAICLVEIVLDIDRYLGAGRVYIP
jgi:hypothetical protein